MKISFQRIPVRWAGWGIGVILLACTWQTRTSWFPALRQFVWSTIGHFKEQDHSDEHGGPSETADGGDSHAGHDHSGHEHADGTSVELSPQARAHLGLTSEFLQTIAPTTFRRTVTVPAVIVERPGRTQLQVATPLTGVVVHVHAVPGESVVPGTLLFQIRLTHEDLVQSQTGFLQTLGELDVEKREIVRLQELTRTGAVSGRTLLDHEYARDKLQAMLDAQREALRLHGLSDKQVESIVQDRRLLRELQVFAPTTDQHNDDEVILTSQPLRRVVFVQNESAPSDVGTANAETTDDAEPHAATTGEQHIPTLVIRTLNVHKGQSVNAGDTLCVVADYSELMIEGLAFEQDAELISRAAQKSWGVSVVHNGSGNQRAVVEELKILRLANDVDSDSRTLKFYVRLPNAIDHRQQFEDGSSIVTWHYRPGQRLQLEVPVEEWTGQLVLPVEAVAREGIESYVFKYASGHFDRVSVHEKYRDQRFVLIEDDGTVKPRDVIALRGAQQLQMALRGQSSGGADAHAGHSH